jgi:RimJ/RimL family protein N-acetyltransferase
MVIHQQHQGFVDYVNHRLNANFNPDNVRTITDLSEDGKIQAVIVFSRHSGSNIEVTFAIDPKYQVTRALIRAFINYVFVQLDLKRVTAFINVSNTKSIEFVERFGFVRECDGPLKDWFKDGDAYVYGLFRGNCKWIK